MKWWKIASSIAAGVVVVSVIALFYSIPVNPCTIFPSQTSSDLVAPASPNELYDNSELVVIGRITDSTARCEGSQIWTHMKVSVEDSAKNPQGIKVLTGKAYGGRIGNYGVMMEDSPIFNKGDRAFLYLYKDNPGDTVYRVSPYSDVLVDENGLPDETITAKEILSTFRMKFVSLDNADMIEISQGTSAVVPINVESFFGYDSPVNVTIPSFAYYNDTIEDVNGTLTSEYADISVLEDFGLSVEPIYDIVQPVVNGSSQTEFSISASDKAVLGLYYVVFSGSEDRYSYLAGGFDNSFVRINVTETNGHSGGDIPAEMLTSEGITIGTPYLVQVSWNLSETFHGNRTDFSVLIKDKDTMKPLEDVTYDFMYKGNFELGGFQDKYIADFSTPDRFRTGIQNPCDMHLTIFIEKVGDLSFAKTDPDEIERYGNTPSVVIQFKSFAEEGSVGDCDAKDNIGLTLFNGYNPDGHRIHPDTDIPIVTTLNSYSLPAEETLTNYTAQQVAEQHRKLCGESQFNSEIASMSEDDPNFRTWLPQRLHFVHIQPKEQIFRQGCFHIPTGIYYEHFIIQNNTAIPLHLSSDIFEIETPEQAVEHIAYFEYGDKNGGISILSDEKEYNEAVRDCGEVNSSPVRNIRVIQFGDGTVSVELNRINWNTGELEYQYWQYETNSTLPTLVSTIAIGQCGSAI